MVGLGDIGTPGSPGSDGVSSGTPGGHMGGDVGEHGGFSNPTQYWYVPGNQGQDDGDLVFVRIGSSQDTPQTRARAAQTNPGWNQEIAMGQPTVGAYVESVAESRRTSTAPSPATTGTQTTAGTTQYGVSSTGLASDTGALTSDIEGILSGYMQDASEATSNLRRFNLTEQASFIPSQGALTGGDYSSRFVDFGKEYYGLRALGDWTSIGVDPDDDETDDEDTDVVYRPSDAETGDGSEAGMDTLGSLGAIGAYDTGVNFGIDTINADSITMTYEESLASLGMTDLIGSFGMDILGPALSGNFGDISFKDAFGSVPENVKDGAKSLAKKESWAADNIAKKGLGLAFSAVGGAAGSAISGILNGDTVKNAFGHDSNRPAGLLGIFADAVHYTQFNDMAAMQAISQSISNSKDFSGIITDYDTGFAIDFGKGGITRGPNSGTWTGNMKGLSAVQANAIEATLRGYTTRSFNSNDGFGNVAGEKVNDIGGAWIDPMNPMAGYISPTGNPVNAFGQGSYYANMTQVDRMAKNYGITSQQVIGAFQRARTEDITVKEALKSVVPAQTFENIYSPGKISPGGTPVQQTGLTQWASKFSTGPSSIFGVAFGTGTSGYSEVSPYAETIDPQTGQATVEEDLGFVPSAPAPAAPDYSNDFGSDSGGFAEGIDDSDAEAFEGLAKGGKVPGYAMGTPPAGVQASQSGFIDRPPSQVTEAGKVADNRPMKAKEGTYIINAAAVEFAGEKDIRKMIMDAQKEAVRRGIVQGTGKRASDLVDIAVSSGEVTIAPHLVKIIGEDRLEKINKRGLRKTEQRIAQNGQQPVGAARGGFLAAGGMALPKSKPKRVNQSALADVELRADLEVYIQNDPLARLGFNLYEKGDVDVKAIIPNPKGKVGIGGLYTPIEDMNNPGRLHTDFERKAKQQGITKFKGNVPRINYFVGESKNFNRETGNLVLLHELRHHAMRHLNKKYKVPMPELQREETLMDVQDYANRIQARKVKPSILKRQKAAGASLRKEAAYLSPSANKEIAMYQKIAEEVLKDRKVPKRTKSKEVEGFFTRAMGILGL